MTRGWASVVKDFSTCGKEDGAFLQIPLQKTSKHEKQQHIYPLKLKCCGSNKRAQIRHPEEPDHSSEWTALPIFVTWTSVLSCKCRSAHCFPEMWVSFSEPHHLVHQLQHAASHHMYSIFLNLWRFAKSPHSKKVLSLNLSLRKGLSMWSLHVPMSAWILHRNFRRMPAGQLEACPG